MEGLQINLVYKWQSVYLREKLSICFLWRLARICVQNTKFLRYLSGGLPEKPGDKKLVYIGEAQELCPKRLYGYLNPGPSQMANKKVNTDFRAYLKEKLCIKLDVCQVMHLEFGGTFLEQGALEDKHTRRFISEALIMEHQKNGYTVVDL